MNSIWSSNMGLEQESPRTLLKKWVENADFIIEL